MPRTELAERSPLVVSVGPAQTVLSAGGGAVAAFGHDGLTAAVEERRWRLEALRRGRAVTTRLDPATGLTSARPEAIAYAVRALGLLLGETYFGAEVAALLDDAVRRAGPAGGVRLGVEVDERRLASIPWEAAILPGAADPLALTPGLRMYRTSAASGTRRVRGPGPLRVLAVFADPVRRSEGIPLDLDSDMLRILNAFEDAEIRHGVVVDTFDGPRTLGEIKARFEAGPYDILHRSCHARSGLLLLEDDRGEPEAVTAERLVREVAGLRDATMVVLAGCSTAVGAAEEGQTLAAAGFAEELARAGVSSVLAMTGLVSDAYAGRFCAEVYRGFAGETTDAAAAVADARRRLELSGAGTGDLPDLSEWQTPVLFARPDEAIVRSANAPVTASNGAPAPSPVTRRAALRDLSALWQNFPAGVIVHGQAGVGKTELVEGFLARLGPSAGTVLRVAPGPDGAAVRRRIAEAPRHDPVILVLDGLTAECRPEVARALAEAPPGLRLIATSRRRLTEPAGAERPLGVMHLGPLSSGEARLLARRLSGLRRLPKVALDRVMAEIGGNPAALGYLDALLRGAPAWRPDLQERLTRWLLAENRTLEGARELGLGAAISTVRGLMAHESDLSALLGELAPGDRRTLAALSVNRRPAEAEAFVRDGDERSIDVLTGLGLLAPADPGHSGLLLVDRWLAGVLAVTDHGSRSADHAAAARYWLEPSRGDGQARELVEDLVEARFHYLRAGQVPDALVVTAGLIDRLQSSGAFSEAERIARDSLTWDGLDDHEKAILHHALGSLAQDSGRPDEARRAQEHARELFLSAGSEEDAASVDLQLAALDEAAGDHSAARARFAQALAYFSAIEDRSEVSRAHHYLGIVCGNLGAYEEAYAHHSAALAMDEEAGDQERIAATLHQLGVIEYQRGNPSAAREYFGRSIGIFERIDDKIGVSSGLQQLGLLAHESGDAREALSLCRRSLRLDDEAGSVSGAARSEHLLGMITHEEGEYEEARTHYHRALALLTYVGEQGSTGVVHHQLGVLEQEAGDRGEAWMHYEEALAIATETSDRVGVAYVYHQFGLLEEDTGELESANGWFDRAMEIFEQFGDRYGKARVFAATARIERRSGRPEAAVEPILRAFSLALEIEDLMAVAALREMARLRVQFGKRGFDRRVGKLVDRAALREINSALDAIGDPGHD